MKKLLILLILSCVTLSACGNQHNIKNDIKENKKDVSVQKEVQKQEEIETVKTFAETWDEYLYLGDEFNYPYKLGDPISTIPDLWSSSRSYLGGELDNNVYTELNIGTFVYSHNINKEACAPENCPLTSIGYLYQGEDNIKKLIPMIPEYEKTEDFFSGCSVEKTYEDSDGEVSKQLIYKDWLIHVYSTDGKAVTGLSFELKDNSLMYDDYFEEEYVKDGDEQINSFRMGFDTWTFKDTDSITIKDYEYIPDTNYTININFTFIYNDIEYDVIMEEFNRGFDAMNIHETTVNNEIMQVGHMKPGSYDYEQRFMCRVPDKADITIFRKGQTEDEFIKVLEALLNNFTMS